MSQSRSKRSVSEGSERLRSQLARLEEKSLTREHKDSIISEEPASRSKASIRSKSKSKLDLTPMERSQEATLGPNDERRNAF